MNLTRGCFPDPISLKPVPVRTGIAILMLLLCGMILPGAAQGADKSQFVSQSYVDTVVQNAFLNFNNTDELAATGMTRQKAIAEARLVIKRLRKLSETDPNKSYILWKVGELESQVYLEEQGLLLDKQQQQQKAANDLVMPFNSEIGKPRPDFSAAWSIQARMAAANPEKGVELEGLIRQRARNIAIEACAFFDRAIEDRDLDKARVELTYLKTQQEHLGIPQNRYAQMAARLQSRVTVDGELSFIKSGFQKTQQHTAALQLGEARQTMLLIRMRLDEARTLIIKPEWDRLDGQFRGVSGRIAAIEDSLVNAALLTLKKNGISAAKEFLETAMRPTAMMAEKISRVEAEVLKAAAVAHAAQDTAMHAEFASLYQQSEGGASMMTDMLAAAKRKSRAKRDSAAGVSDALKGATTQREEVRRERADIALANRQDRDAQQSQPDENRGLSQIERLRRERGQLAQAGMQERADITTRENREKAEKTMVEIYTLLEQKKTRQAFEQFKGDKEYLKKYLDAGSFSSLDSAMSRQNSGAGKK